MNSALEDIKRELQLNNLFDKPIIWISCEKEYDLFFSVDVDKLNPQTGHYIKINSGFFKRELRKEFEGKSPFDFFTKPRIMCEDLFKLEDLLFLKHTIVDIFSTEELASKTYISDWEKEFDDFLKNSPKITWKDINDNLAN